MHTTLHIEEETPKEMSMVSIFYNVETNAISDNTLCFQLFYLTAFMSDRDRMVVRFITTYAICAYHFSLFQDSAGFNNSLGRLKPRSFKI
jgi:hypothetical protein